MYVQRCKYHNNIAPTKNIIKVKTLTNITVNTCKNITIQSNVNPSSTGQDLCGDQGEEALERPHRYNYLIIIQYSGLIIV